MKVNQNLLDLLNRLKDRSRPVSGEALAADLGVSRVALWKRIQTLKSMGYAIGSDRRGYWLLARDQIIPNDVSADGPPIHFYPVVDSTMDLARDLALSGTAEGTLVVAGRQTRGRGTQGRTWLSPTGGLYCTMILRWDIPTARAGAIVLEAMASLAEILESQGSKDLHLAWPNDLYRKSAKVGGFLLEAHGGLHRPDFWLLGIGLNVHDPQDATLANLERAWTTLDERDFTVSRRQILTDFRQALLSRGPRPQPRIEVWERFSWERGRKLLLSLRSDDGTPTVLEGEFQGYNPYGDLMIDETCIRFGDCLRVEGV